MERRRLAMFLLSLALMGAMAGAGFVDGIDTGALFLAPAFLLLVPLVAGRYVGEKAIARWAASRPPARWRPVASLRPRACPDAVLGATGLLLARRLAGRAPPRVAAASVAV